MSDVLQRVNSKFPNLQITKVEFQRPTSDMVMRFYTHFLSEYEEQISLALTWYQDNLRSDLDPEELIYLKMKKLNRIFELANMTFILGDIYEPTPQRTKIFFRMCLHFLEYICSTSVYLVKPTTVMLKEKEDIDKYRSETDQLQEEIDEATRVKDQLVKDNEELKDEIKVIEGKKEDYLIERSRKKSQFQEKRKEVDRLKMKVAEKTSTIMKLEAKEKILVEEIVNEEEYLGLQELYKETLAEKQSLEDQDVDMDADLSHENHIFNHYKECHKTNLSTFDVDLIKVHIKLEDEVEYLQNEKELLLSKLASQKSIHAQQEKIHKESRNTFMKSRSENETVKKEFEQNSKEMLGEISRFKQAVHQSSKECLSENQALEQHIVQLEDDSKKLKQHFKMEYGRVKEVQREVFRKFRAQIEEMSL